LEEAIYEQASRRAGELASQRGGCSGRVGLISSSLERARADRRTLADLQLPNSKIGTSLIYKWRRADQRVGCVGRSCKKHPGR
jgi:hypothetical protein